MNANLNAQIRRLMNVFIILFLAISGIAAYIQIGNQAFFNGPVLAHGKYDTGEARNCPPFDEPVRGTIYDRSGIPLAWSVPDKNAYCGYRRVYDSRVASTGLAPFIGYFSYRYGTAGVEAAFDDILAGTNSGQQISNVYNKLLHQPEAGNDIYLTIDIKLQAALASYYEGAALHFGPGQVCPPSSGTPNGSAVVEDPNTGQILAMYSFPSYDPNKIDSGTYFQQLQSSSRRPLINRALNGQYVPGSTFKTVTLIAGLDTGKYSLSTPYDKNTAVYFQVPQGSNYNWVDYQGGEWPKVHQTLDSGGTISLEDAYAYSDNSVFARVASELGADTWLSYVRKFGIQTPGTDVTPVPVDSGKTQTALSYAYPAISGGKVQFTGDDLAASGFGQGALLITPITMAEVTSSVAANGVLYDPYTVMGYEAHTTKANVASMTTYSTDIYSGGPIFQPQTAQSVRQAMYAVASYGTASTFGQNPDPVNGQNPTLAASPTHEGGKTGTGQIGSGGPRSWYISLAPDDAAPGGSAARLVVIVQKEENSGDGGCSIYVADNTEVYAMDNHIGPFAKKP